MRSQRPEPSHKAGQVRDKRIEELQRLGFGPEHLRRIIKKAATTPRKR